MWKTLMSTLSRWTRIDRLTPEQRKVVGRRCVLGSLVFVVIPLNIEFNGLVKALFHVLFALTMCVGATLAFDDKPKK